MPVDQVANHLRVHPSTIYRLIKAGKLPAFKVDSDWRFNGETIQRWCLEAEKNLPVTQ
jgi:excisionase family DNA binding protein